jgi:hypothetical protein
LVETKVIKSYEVYYLAKFPPKILLKGDKYFGQLIFQPNGTTLLPDKIEPANLSLYYHQDVLYTVYYHLDDFPNVIDLLRNEKPMWLIWAGEGANSENGIKTYLEAVGSNEVASTA